MTVIPELVALTATCRLHTELLADKGFAGYDGTKAQFDSLYREIFSIARDKVSPGIESVEQIIETFYEHQGEISEGTRDVNWYL